MSTDSPFAILIIDDEIDTLKTFQMQFKNNFTILTASSGQEAWNTLTSYKDKEIAAVVVDQRMPEMTGLELMLKIKKEYPLIVRVLFTGYSEVKIIESIVNEAEIFKYIHKPYAKEDVSKILTNCLQQYTENKNKQRHLNHTMKLIQEKTASAMENYTCWITHHVNNSLQAIKTYIDLSAPLFSTDEGKADFAKTAQNYVNNLAAIAQNLLAIYSQTLENFVSTPLETLLKFEEPDINKKIQDKKIVLKKESRNGTLQLMADPMAIQECIRKLVDNSINASPEGATIEVIVDKMHDAGKEAVIFQVKDHGSGMDSETKDKLFFPFFTMGTNAQNFRGLSLCYVQAIIARHGGDIMVESKVGGGTTITFTLPIIQNKQAQATESLKDIQKEFAKRRQT